uniref:Uncharacterized protein n=1 Tax=Euplotes harpa TaxID=151035 RepID=A0A7S3NEM0_9SPIT|mmetsp:Transcript_43256/g.50767  ORF Transcript_43256/g.50767 Transcript_43256/m.50767 type:complete len:571 (+) Transcript_43256:3891-5603(+)
MLKRKSLEWIRESYDTVLTDFNRETVNRLFYFFFISKRFLSVFVCFFVSSGYLQLMVIIGLQFAFMLYIGYCNPFRKSRDLALTFINEIFIVLILGGMIKFSDLTDETMPLGDEHKSEGTFMAMVLGANLAILIFWIVATDICGYINYYRVRNFKKGKEGKEGAEDQDIPKYMKRDDSSEESMEKMDHENVALNQNVHSQHSFDSQVKQDQPQVKSKESVVDEKEKVGFANLVPEYDSDSLEKKKIIENQLPLMPLELKSKQNDDFAWNNLDKEIEEVTQKKYDDFQFPKAGLDKAGMQENPLLKGFPSLPKKRGLPPLSSNFDNNDSLNDTGKPLADSIDNIYNPGDGKGKNKKRNPKDIVKIKKVKKQKAGKKTKGSKAKPAAKKNRLKLAQQLSGEGFELDDPKKQAALDWELLQGQKIVDAYNFINGDEEIDNEELYRMLDADEIFQMLDEEEKLERIMRIRRKLQLKKLKMIKLQKLKAQLNVMQGKGAGLSKKAVTDQKDIFDMVYEEKVEEEIKELEKSSDESDDNTPEIIAKNMFVQPQNDNNEESSDDNEDEGDDESIIEL